MKAEYTMFKDHSGYWFWPKLQEADVIACPDNYRIAAKIVKTKIEACRLALDDAKSQGATEIHLHGLGSTTSIKRDAKALGIKPFVYHPSIATDLTR
jgi:hypothetical protein